MSGGDAAVDLPEGVRRVRAALAKHGHPCEPRLLDQAARTAQQAADQLDVALGQIAKSIIFRRVPDDRAVLVITSGDRRVDERKVESLVCGPGQSLGRADAAFVKAQTGYSIGGVPPLSHLSTPLTLIDRELSRFDQVWAAAGHPHAVFMLSPTELSAMTGAALHDVTVDSERGT